MLHLVAEYEDAVPQEEKDYNEKQGYKAQALQLFDGWLDRNQP